MNETKKNKKIEFTLLKVLEYKKKFNKDENPECDICYKRINNKVFVCADPCNKTFHQTCMETMIEHIESNADEEGKDDACYQCCYCRREFDINAYELALFTQTLLSFKGQGYIVEDAITLSTFNTITHSADEDMHYQYSIYLPLDTSFIKTPKQSKRGAFKQKQKYKHSSCLQVNMSKKRMPLGRR